MLRARSSTRSTLLQRGCDIAFDVKGRHLAIGLLVLLFGAVALIFYIGVTGGSRHDPAGRRGDQGSPVSFSRTPAATASSSAGPDAATARRLADERKKRDELRQKILEAWAKGDTITAGMEDAKQGRFAQHPNADGYGIEPKYIQAAIREQMLPMLRNCYEDLRSRQPDAGGGTVQLWFKIVADDKLGGIVEEDETADGGGGSLDGQFGDEMMRTCVRESLSTVMFPPPAKDGVVTVGYPITLSPNDEDDEDGGK